MSVSVLAREAESTLYVSVFPRTWDLAFLDGVVVLLLHKRGCGGDGVGVLVSERGHGRGSGDRP